MMCWVGIFPFWIDTSMLVGVGDCPPPITSPVDPSPWFESVVERENRRANNTILCKVWVKYSLSVLVITVDLRVSSSSIRHPWRTVDITLSIFHSFESPSLVPLIRSHSFLSSFSKHPSGTLATLLYLLYCIASYRRKIEPSSRITRPFPTEIQCPRIGKIKI